MTGRPADGFSWTLPKVWRILALQAEHHTLAEIAEIFTKEYGRRFTARILTEARTKYAKGAPRTYKRTFTPQVSAELEAMWAEGKSVKYMLYAVKMRHGLKVSARRFCRYASRNRERFPYRKPRSCGASAREA